MNRAGCRFKRDRYRRVPHVEQLEARFALSQSAITVEPIRSHIHAEGPHAAAIETDARRNIGELHEHVPLATAPRPTAQRADDRAPQLHSTASRQPKRYVGRVYAHLPQNPLGRPNLAKKRGKVSLVKFRDSGPLGSMFG